MSKLREITTFELEQAAKYWTEVLGMAPPKYSSFNSFENFAKGYVAGLDAGL